MRSLFHASGIHHCISCPHAHQQMGLVERKHHHVIETGLALLAHAFVPHLYWPEAFRTAVYLINRLPSPMFHGQSPFSCLFHKSSDYKFLWVFGSACWPNLHPFNKHKMDYRSTLCVFLGYNPDRKGYLCLHKPTGRLYVSRDVRFDKQHFPFATPIPAPVSPLILLFLLSSFRLLFRHLSSLFLLSPLGPLFLLLVLNLRHLCPRLLLLLLPCLLLPVSPQALHLLLHITPWSPGPRLNPCVLVFFAMVLFTGHPLRLILLPSLLYLMTPRVTEASKFLEWR